MSDRRTASKGEQLLKKGVVDYPAPPRDSLPPSRRPENGGSERPTKSSTGQATPKKE